MCKKRHTKQFLDKKAQLTMFFLIGIFLIGVFAFIFYLNSQLAEDALRAPTEKILTDLLKSGAIPYYVGVCLEENAKDALFLAGQQGGNIFVDQKGPAPSPIRFIPLSYRVPYGISGPSLVNGTSYPHAPGYPGGEGKTSQVPNLNFGTWGRFGELSLRKLCDSYGANSPSAFEKYGYAGDVISIGSPDKIFLLSKLLYK